VGTGIAAGCHQLMEAVRGDAPPCKHTFGNPKLQRHAAPRSASAIDALAAAGRRPLRPPRRRERRSGSGSGGDEAGIAVASIKTHLPQAPESGTDLLRDPVPPVLPVIAGSAGPASARRHRGRGMMLALFALVMVGLCGVMASVLLLGPGGTTADGENGERANHAGRAAARRH
jgi:hypothetical protein